jgi:hypothetical protein
VIVEMPVKRQAKAASLPSKVSDWNEEWTYRFHERAGIMEFDGNMDRAWAEREAERACREEYRREAEVNNA